MKPVCAVALKFAVVVNFAVVVIFADGELVKTAALASPFDMTKLTSRRRRLTLSSNALILLSNPSHALGINGIGSDWPPKNAAGPVSTALPPSPVLGHCSPAGTSVFLIPHRPG